MSHWDDKQGRMQEREDSLSRERAQEEEKKDRQRRIDEDNKKSLEESKALELFIKQKDISRTKSEEAMAIEVMRDVRNIKLSGTINKINILSSKIGSLEKQKIEEKNKVSLKRENVENSTYCDFFKIIMGKNYAREEINECFNKYLIETDLEIKPSEEENTIVLASQITFLTGFSDEEIEERFSNEIFQIKEEMAREQIKLRELNEKINKSKFEELLRTYLYS